MAIKVYQFEDKTGAKVAPLTPESAVYDQSGTHLDDKLATLAKKTEVTAKADKSYVDTQLATKANTSAIPDVSGKANKTDLGTISSLTTTDKSSAVAAINEISTEITDLQDEKANVDGYYEDLCAGALAPSGAAISCEFTMQQTANGAVANGISEIVRIKGNTIVQDEQLVSMTANALRINGVNLWDEQWESGYLSYSVGDTYEKRNNANYIRSKNKIPLVKGVTYRIKKIEGTTFSYFIYDANDVLVKSNPSTIVADTDGCYLGFYWNKTSYDGGIVLSVVKAATDYVPYVSPTTKSLSFISQYFPNGMRSAGTAYDELTANKAVKRIGVVDLGTLDWKTTSVENKFVTDNLNIFKPQTNNHICAKYTTQSCVSYGWGSANLPDGSICTHNSANSIFVRDSAYSTKEEFKAAMSGVLWFFELPEPEDTAISPALDLKYKVIDGGSEEIVSSSASAPIKTETIYNIDLVATMRKVLAAISAHGWTL